MLIHRYIYILAILFIWGNNASYAQVGENNNITPNVKNFIQEGDSLRIDIDFDLTGLKLSSRDQLILTPIIKNTQKELALNSVIVNGKIRHKVYLRQMAFGTLEEQDKLGTEVVRKAKQHPQIVSYSTVVKLEDWMQTAALYLQESNCPGCGKTPNIYDRLLANNPTLEIRIPNTPQPMFSFVIPPADSIKMGNRQGSAYLKFHVSRYAIDPALADNAAELDKIHATLEQLINDKNVSIKKISITGFASIEGNFDFNKHLSEERAKSLQNYIQQRYNLPHSLFNINWGGEDWVGLIALIENGDMEKKQEVLAIINETDIFDGREKQLMELAQGQPYRFMFDKYFPLLRKVDYLIEYTLPEFALEDSKQIIKNNADQLSRRELFLLADSYGRGSAKFYEILDVALTLYPNDITTRQNAAAAYAMQGKYDKAEQLALKSGDSGEALNNLGAIYLLQGKLNESENLLLKGKQAGNKETLYNLNELYKIQKNQNNNLK